MFCRLSYSALIVLPSVISGVLFYKHMYLQQLHPCVTHPFLNSWQTTMIFCYQVILNYTISKCKLIKPSTEEEDSGGRRISHPRPWSVVGRKKPHSESSSMLHQRSLSHELPLSPTLLPTLFNGTSDIRPRSPLSIDTVFSHHLNVKEAHIAGDMSHSPTPDSITSKFSK